MFLIITCWDAFYVFPGVEIHFVVSLPLDGFGQHKLRCTSRLWSSHIEMPRWHGRSLVNTCWEAFYVVYLEDTSSDAFCVIDGMGSVWSTILRCIFCPGSHRRCLVNTWWDGYCVLTGILGVCSTHVILMPSLVWDGFGQNLLRYILYPRWHGMSRIITCWDEFCVFAGVAWV